MAESRLAALLRVVPWLTVRRLASTEKPQPGAMVYAVPTEIGAHPEPATIWAYLRGRVR